MKVSGARVGVGKVFKQRQTTQKQIIEGKNCWTERSKETLCLD